MMSLSKWIPSMFLAVAFSGSFALTAQEIKLPSPDKKGGKTLMECLAERKTSRSFNSKPLPLQLMANLLYAADGINRPDGRKTVPTARNAQNQKIYAVTKDGAWLYLPKSNTMKLMVKGDLRAQCGKQPFHAKAPLVLVYVADLPKIGKNLNEQTLYAGNHAGYASQNVYLYAASEGLSTVVCGMVDRKNLKKVLKLKEHEVIVFTQPVGYPGK